MKRSTAVVLFVLVLLLAAGIFWWRQQRTMPVPLSAAPVVPTPAPSAPAAPSVPIAPAPAPAPLPKPSVKPKTSAAHPAPAVKPSTPAAVRIPAPAAIPKPVPPAPPPPPPVPAEPQPQEWKGIDTSITHSGQVVIRNDHQWIQFWSEHHPHEPAPDVDFTRWTVIGVFSGPRPADSFSIQILSWRQDGKNLVVEYREQLPPPGTVAINVTAYPYDLKTIPQTKLPVKFHQQETKQ